MDDPVSKDWWSYHLLSDQSTKTCSLQRDRYLPSTIIHLKWLWFILMVLFKCILGSFPRRDCFKGTHNIWPKSVTLLYLIYVPSALDRLAGTLSLRIHIHCVTLNLNNRITISQPSFWDLKYRHLCTFLYSLFLKFFSAWFFINYHIFSLFLSCVCS